MADANSPIDMDKLNSNFMQNQDIIKQILAAFKESFDDFEEQFRDAEGAGDVEVMSRLAHSLKGSAANITADVVASQAATLQHKVDDGADSEIEPCFDDLLKRLDELNGYIDTLL